MRADRPIEDYALIGDMRGAALVATDASIDWLCLGRFDAIPVFCALLDAQRGGRCSVAFDPPLDAVSRRYVAGTNVLETRFASAAAEVVVVDFMPVSAIENADIVGPDSAAAGCVTRMIRCERGAVSAEVRVSATFDWARRTVAPTVDDGVAAWPGESLRCESSSAVDLEHDGVRSHADLMAGGVLTVVLSAGDPLTRPSVAADATRRLDETLAYWNDWARQCTYRGEESDLVLRSALALKLLTYAPTGAFIAAPTAGLPEVVGGVRNWDYRYVWTRDASFCVSAFINLGFRREAAEFLRFLHQACDHGEAVRVLYAIDGDLPEVRRLDHLVGWRGSAPVMTGNDAGEQKQFEIFGELLIAIDQYVAHYGVDGLCPELVDDLPDFVDRLAEAAIRFRRSHDQGIWELKGHARHLVHTKGMCGVALDRAVSIAKRLDLAVPPAWAVQRDAVRAELLERGWNADRRALTMEYGGDAVDMALLRLPLLDFLDPADSRITSTLAALTRDLAVGGLHRRYRMDDGLPGEEGAFLACSFWMAGVQMQRGDIAAASDLIARLLACANDVGLYAEQLDVASGAHLGNFPQAFTHMAVIQEVLRLDDARKVAGAHRKIVDKSTISEAVTDR